MAFGALLNPVLNPLLLGLPPIVAVLIVSLVVSVIMTFAYKWMTDQKKMKELKDKQKAFQKEIKANKQDPKKAMAIQKKAMEANMQYMKASFKPMIVTFIPIILIFGWLNLNLAFDPILPGEEFEMELQFNEGVEGNITASLPEGVSVLGAATQEIDKDSQAKFKFTAAEGAYIIVFNKGDRSYQKEVIVTEEQRYEEPVKIFKSGAVKNIKTANEKLIVLSLLGKQEGNWKQGRIGWLGLYILASIIISTALRKGLKIY